MENKEIEIKELIKRFDDNSLSECIIFAGLEPILQFKEIMSFISEFRKKHKEEIVIYTGYYPNEIKCYIEELKQFKNIIIKFGRYVQGLESIYDNILGVQLISKNQFAERIENI